MATVVVEVDVAMAGRTIAVDASETMHPGIHGGLVHFVGEQQAVGIDDFSLANPFNLDEDGIGVGLEDYDIALPLGDVLKRALEIGLGNCGIK